MLVAFPHAAQNLAPIGRSRPQILQLTIRLFYTNCSFNASMLYSIRTSHPTRNHWIGWHPDRISDHPEGLVPASVNSQPEEVWTTPGPETSVTLKTVVEPAAFVTANVEGTVRIVSAMTDDPLDADGK